MATNNFLPFCPTDTGTNLLTDSAYAAATGRVSGNVPGVASSALVNKALRQANFITSQLAQLIANQTNTNVNDDANTAAFLAQLSATIVPLQPSVTAYTAGTGTHVLTYRFFISSGNATTGATYTHNGTTYTVSTTITAGAVLTAKGNAVPLASGTLTKATGTGDATITFYAMRTPYYLRVRAVGGGGGGGGSGTASNGIGGGGGNTTFGTVITCSAGGGGASSSGGSGGGGGATLGTAVGVAFTGGNGDGLTTVAANFVQLYGGRGGGTPFGAGAPGGGGSAGTNAQANTGAGGGGGSGIFSASQQWVGGGGGGGGYVDAIIISPLATYAYGIGAGGTAGNSGTGGFFGGTGGSGFILVEEHYQ